MNHSSQTDGDNFQNVRGGLINGMGMVWYEYSLPFEWLYMYSEDISVSEILRFLSGEIPIYICT